MNIWANSEAVKNFAETLAILVGGTWAFYRFVIRRESKPALDIAQTCETIQMLEGHFLAYFDVTLTNKQEYVPGVGKKEEGRAASVFGSKRGSSTQL
jgi:hypothetical protein